MVGLYVPVPLYGLPGVDVFHPQSAYRIDSIILPIL